MFKKFSVELVVVFGFLLLLIIIIPITVKEALGTWAVYNSDTAAVGDTIGGISAPFLNLIAIILVYRSFEAQRDANDLQLRSSDLNLIIELQKQVAQDLETFKFNYHGTEYIGAHAYEQFEVRLSGMIDSKETESLEKYSKQVDYLCHSFLLLIDKINRSTLSSEDKRLFRYKLNLFYTSSIFEPSIKLIKTLDDRKKVLAFSSSLNQLHSKINTDLV